MANIHVAACTHVGNEQFHAEALDSEVERTLLEVLAHRVDVSPEEIERLIQHRDHR